MTNGNKMIYLGLGAIPFIFLGLLFFICSRFPDAMPLSVDAFYQPFQGDYAMFAYILTALLFMDVAYYTFAFLPQSISEPKNHLVLLAFPEIASVFGLIIGMLNRNPWGAIPFFVLGIGWYAYAYLKVSPAAS